MTNCAGILDAIRPYVTYVGVRVTLVGMRATYGGVRVTYVGIRVTYGDMRVTSEHLRVCGHACDTWGHACGKNCAGILEAVRFHRLLGGPLRVGPYCWGQARSQFSGKICMHVCM